MRYVRSKTNLIKALANLQKWVDKNWVEDARRDNPIRALSEGLEDAMEQTELEFPDTFGTEGFERSIYGK